MSDGLQSTHQEKKVSKHASTSTAHWCLDQRKPQKKNATTAFLLQRASISLIKDYSIAADTIFRAKITTT